MTKAFWIQGNNIYDISPESHISFVIKNPELFNLSLDEIKAIYRSFNERLYTESKARQAIIERLFQYDWIRVRERHSKWVFEMDKKRLKSIINFLKYALEKKYLDTDTRIQINTESDIVICFVEEGIECLDN